MDWQMLLIVVFGLIAFYNIYQLIKNKKLKSLDIFSISVKKKVIKFATPHRIEMILLSLFITFLLWWDVLQNKVLDLGLDYKVTWFGGIKTNALDLGIIILIMFHITLMGLFLFSLKSKSTSRFYDIIIGIIAFFSVAILLAGFVNSLYSDTIRFLFVDMNSVDFYHIGIAGEFLTAFYYAFTK